MKGVKAMRIYVIDTVRKSASKIFSVPSATDNTYYATSYDRSTVPAFVDLLKSPKQPHEAFAIYPRVLFTNYEVVDKELFGSSAILNVSQSHSIHWLPLTAVVLDLESGSPRINLRRPHLDLDLDLGRKIWPEGDCPQVGIEVHNPGMYRHGGSHCLSITLFALSWNLPLISRHSSSSRPTAHFPRREPSQRSNTATAFNSTRDSSSKTSTQHKRRHWWHDSTQSSSKPTRWTANQPLRPRVYRKNVMAKRTSLRLFSCRSPWVRRNRFLPISSLIFNPLRREYDERTP